MDIYEKHVLESAGTLFDMDGFFEGEEEMRSATALITSLQAITIPNIDDWKGDHTTTQDCILNVIYNKTENGPKELLELKRKSIRMRLIGSKNEYKLIQIEFPDEITEEQVNLLQAYQNTYGDIVDRIGRECDNDKQRRNHSLIYIKVADDKYKSCQSFQEVVTYAQNLPRIETQNTPEEKVIGQVLSADGLTLCKYTGLVSLKLLNDGVLAHGKVTREDCRPFLEQIMDTGDMSQVRD